MCQQSAIALLFLTASAAVRASLPLTVEDLLSEKDKLKLELSVAYANADRQGISTGEELKSMFHDASGPMQLATLSPQEMKDTEGAFNSYGAFLGGLGGGLGCTFFNHISGSLWSWYGFGTSQGW